MNNPADLDRLYNPTRDSIRSISSIRNETSHIMFAMTNNSLMVIVRKARQMGLNTRSNIHAMHRLTDNIYAEHLQCVNNLFNI